MTPSRRIAVGVTGASGGAAGFDPTMTVLDYLRQSDIFYALGTTVERTPDHMAVFGVQCGHRKGPFSKEAANMVELTNGAGSSP